VPVSAHRASPNITVKMLFIPEILATTLRVANYQQSSLLWLLQSRYRAFCLIIEGGLTTSIYAVDGLAISPQSPFRVVGENFPLRANCGRGFASAGIVSIQALQADMGLISGASANQLIH